MGVVHTISNILGRSRVRALGTVLDGVTGQYDTLEDKKGKGMPKA